MGKQISMAYTAAEKKERNKKMDNPCMPSSGPDYPYGLCLNLDDEHLKKLGIKSLPDVGDTMTVEATVKVTSVSQNSSERGSNSRRVELQITKMSLEQGEGSMEEAIGNAIDDAE